MLWSNLTTHHAALPDAGRQEEKNEKMNEPQLPRENASFCFLDQAADRILSWQRVADYLRAHPDLIRSTAYKMLKRGDWVEDQRIENGHYYIRSGASVPALRTPGAKAKEQGK
jgi:hypothetical protein